MYVCVYVCVRGRGGGGGGGGGGSIPKHNGNNLLPLMADAVLGKDVHSGRGGNCKNVRKLLASIHSDSHTSVLMSTHSSNVGW